MNRERRAKVVKIRNEAEDLRYRLEELAEEERGAFENLPEGIQVSEGGERIGEIADMLEGAVMSFEEIIQSLEEVV